LMNNQFEVLKDSPEYVKENLVFPYSYGAAFMQKARAHNEPWSVVDKIYADLPSSTEQIMHPEKYLANRDNPKPVQVEDPTPQLGKAWKITYKNVMGEFGLFLLLKLHLSEESARAAAAGWGGDQAILLEEDGSNNHAVFFESTWDDKEAADRHYAALASWLQNKYSQGRKTAESENGFAMLFAGEYVAIRRRGNNVRLILGLPESYAEKLNDR
jgi:hypothetical protein